ncbi:MAG: SAF domain-containing protein, partial [Alphaproteobacteria bacterium]
VALGAAVIEKHLTLARADGGLDAEFSLEPDEFAALAANCRTAWEALGEISYARKPSEKGSAGFRRSLYVVADIPAGAPLTRDNVRAIRPGFGLAPKHLDAVLDRRAARALARGEALAWDMIEGGAPGDG